MTRIVLSSLHLHPSSPIEALSAAREAGFQGVEILCEPPWHPRAWPPSLLREVASAADKLSLSLHAPTGDVNLVSRHPDARRFAEAELSRTIVLAARIGATHITVHLGYRSSGVPGEIPYEEAKEILFRLKRRAEDTGVTLCLENDPRSPFLYLWDLSEWGKWLEELDMSGTLDLGHAWISHGERLPELLAGLSPRIAVVHVSDNHGERDEHLPLGAGDIPVRELLGMLKGAEVWVLELMQSDGIEGSLELMRDIMGEG
ncbi:TPA: sugar phosphate isomerase/epimerase [Candidatus Micrarchaeota archaeon]|nr:sugar phosphate isomerase/epimerase [Candidatus Micrarchaeota archaeon]